MRFHVALAAVLMASLSLPGQAETSIVYRATPSIVEDPRTPADLSFASDRLQGLDVQAPATTGPARQVLVRNDGETASQPVLPNLPTGFTLTGNDCTEGVPAGESCALSIAGTGNRNGLIAGDLIVEGIAGQVLLTGTVRGFDPVVSFSGGSSDISIADGSTQGPSATFTVRNTGAGPSGSITRSLSVGSTHFRITGGTCGTTVTSLAANTGSCTVQVARTASGNDQVRSGTLQIAFANAGTSISRTVSFSGTASGFTPACSTSVPNHDYCMIGSHRVMRFATTTNGTPVSFYAAFCDRGTTWNGTACAGGRTVHDFASAKTSCGSGFRAPTETELGAMLNSPLRSSFAQTYYRTSTATGGMAGHSRIIDFSIGWVRNVPDSSTYYVRCVRNNP